MKFVIFSAMAKIGANQPGGNVNMFRKPHHYGANNGYGGKGHLAGGAGAPKGTPDANLIFGVKPKYVHQKGVPDNVTEQFRSSHLGGAVYGGGGGGAGSSGGGGGLGPNPGCRSKR